MHHRAAEIRELLERLDREKAAELESETLEFKQWSQEWDRSDAGRKKFYHTLAEYAVCFANHKGGTLVLGVRDDVRGKERAVTGCGTYNLQEIRTRIYDATDPKILVEVEELHVEELGVRLLLVHVPRGIGVHTTTDGVAKMRVGTECKPMTGSLRQQRLVELGLADVTAQTVAGSPSDAFDPMEIERLERLIRGRTPDSPLLRLGDAELLEQVGITENGRPTIAGVLLVGKEEVIRRHVPFHEVEYLRMKSDTEYERRQTYTYGLLRILEEVERNIELYNSTTTVEAGLFHDEVKDFPEGTYREAVLNAVVHRDYLSPGSVFIKHYADRLEISNPGGFIAGITPENILRQDSHPRNRRLAEIFRRVGLVEKAGMGVKRMFYAQLSSGKQPPHYWTDGASVRLALLDGSLDEAFVRFIRRQEREGRPLGLDELLVLSLLRHQRELSLPEAASVLQLDRERTRQILMRMVSVGLLERSGVRKGQVFRLSGALYRELGQSVAYIRERGIDQLRHEELVLSYIRQYGHITNRQVRELLGLDKFQASRLLRSLLESGKVVRQGKSDRDAHYELPRN